MKKNDLHIISFVLGFILLSFFSINLVFAESAVATSTTLSNLVTGTTSGHLVAYDASDIFQQSVSVTEGNSYYLSLDISNWIDSQNNAYAGFPTGGYINLTGNNTYADTVLADFAGVLTIRLQTQSDEGSFDFSNLYLCEGSLPCTTNFYICNDPIAIDYLATSTNPFECSYTEEEATSTATTTITDAITQINNNLIWICGIFIFILGYKIMHSNLEK